MFFSRQSFNKNITKEEKEKLLTAWKNTIIAFESMKENESNDSYDELFKRVNKDHNVKSTEMGIEAAKEDKHPSFEMSLSSK